MAKLLPSGVISDSEGTSSRGFPDVLLIIIMLRGDGDFVSYKVGRVESNAESASVKALVLDLAIKRPVAALYWDRSTPVFTLLSLYPD